MPGERILIDPSVRRLATELTALRRELETVKAGMRATQLGQSTLHGGRLLIRDDDGGLRGWLGKQPDGTFGLGAANGEPPSRPNTPVLEAFPGGVRVVWNGELLAALPGDFSHLLVYLSPAGVNFIAGPSNLAGTLLRAGSLPLAVPDGVPYWCRLVAVNTSGVESEPSLTAGPVSAGQVVAGAVVDGIVGTLALADAAVTEAKHAAGSVTATVIANDAVTSPNIIANAIQAIHVAADAISAGKIAADVITGREIAALSILAEHIRANQIDATHVQAGVINAVHLAAEIILASRIILGDPVGARLEIDQFGIAQFSNMGDPTLKLGRDPRGGNYLTIVDPTDPQKALASISDQGVMSASGFAVSGNLSYNGDELGSLISVKPRGVVAWGSRGTNSDTTSSEIGVLELPHNRIAGRMYRIQSSQIIGRGGRLDLHLRFTTDGSRPTVSSSRYSTAFIPTDEGNMISAIYSGQNDHIRWLLTARSLDAVAVFVETPVGFSGIQMWVEDIGPDPGSTGIPVSGSGTDTPPKQTYVTEWLATWHGTWNPGLRSGLADMVQGTYGGETNRAAFGFDVTNIRSTLSGATINGVELYLYVNHTYYNSGGFARIRTHNGIPDGVYPGVSGVRWVEKFGKPEGRWLDVGTTVGEEFRDGLTSGFALDATDVAASLHDYIRVNGSGQNLRPAIKITYTK